MSFWPFPRSLTEALARAARRGPILEPGAGEGRLHRRLRQAGIASLPLDLRVHPGVTRLRADVRALPLRRGRTGGLVLGNLVRHLDARGTGSLAAAAWDALAPGGGILVLEDDPDATRPAEVNYRRALQLLASADPTRGPALSADDFVSRVEGNWGPPDEVARVANVERVVDPVAPVRWLQAHRPGPDVDALAAAVAREGMAYGGFWCARWERT